MTKKRFAPYLIILYLLTAVALSRAIEIRTGKNLRLACFCIIVLFLSLNTLMSYRKAKFEPFELIDIFILVHAFVYFLRPVMLLIKPELAVSLLHGS